MSITHDVGSKLAQRPGSIPTHPHLTYHPRKWRFGERNDDPTTYLVLWVRDPPQAGQCDHVSRWMVETVGFEPTTCACFTVKLHPPFGTWWDSNPQSGTVPPQNFASVLPVMPSHHWVTLVTSRGERTYIYDPAMSGNFGVATLSCPLLP